MSTADFLSTLARTSFAGGVLVLLVLAVQLVFRKQLAPRWHCALWLLVFVRLVPFSLSSPTSVFNLLRFDNTPASLAPLVLPVSDPRARESAAVAPLPETSAPAIREPDDAMTTSAATHRRDAASGITFVTWTRLGFFVWLAGVLLLATRVICGVRSASRRFRAAVPVDQPKALEVLHACCALMSVRRAPRLFESDAIASPALQGVFRPRLLLPRGFATTFSVEELRFVFLHELAHLRRGDLLLNWLAIALQIVHWFNPLVWFGLARWRIDREVACDAAAIEAAGTASNHAYGRTMLRLLENLSFPQPRASFVGILEDKRQLRRRMRMIANFAPARRPFVAAAVFALLAIAGLTDAQVAPTSEAPLPANVRTSPISHDVVVPPNSSAHVVFLLNASESMLGETIEEIAARRAETTASKRSSPKWRQALLTLNEQLADLPAGVSFDVVLLRDDPVDGDGNSSPWVGSGHRLQNSVAFSKRHILQSIVPSGGAGRLQNALRWLAAINPPRLQKIVLITDDFPTSLKDAGKDPQRLEEMKQEITAFPPRVPVHTILLPKFPADHAVAGFYWQLAHATRGSLWTFPGFARIAPDPARERLALSDLGPTHIAFVVDTSGSMRNPNTGGLWPVVMQQIDSVLDRNSGLAGVQLIDGDGRFILGRRNSTGKDAWLANTPELRAQLRETLGRYQQDSVSNPVPGVTNAVRFLHDAAASDMRMAIYVLGDEFNSNHSPDTVLHRLDELNPRDARGRRPIMINAIGFPTTIRSQFSMGNTGLRFAALMRTITHEHGGTFVALPDL